MPESCISVWEQASIKAQGLQQRNEHMKKTHTPIIVGADQFTQQKETISPQDPVSLMAKTSNNALHNAGNDDLRDLIDMVCVSNIAGWQYRDPSSLLCNILHIKPAKKIYPFIGGNLPQKFVNSAARAIATGECRAVLITGGEAHYSIRRNKKGEIELDWPEQQKPDHIEGDRRLNSSNFENSYNLLMPIGIYAMLETVQKEKSGKNWEDHNRSLGKILEGYSKIASENPHAWSREAYTAHDIITPTADNRYICYPYTIRMVANIQVDQSAALVMTSVDIAEKLGIDRRLWVYPMGGADIENIFYTIQRPELHTSPATVAGAGLALAQAGLSLKEIDLFDLYSCFPSMIQLLRHHIGIQEDDTRPLTVTGGLPYFGAPLNNYSLHAIAAIVERIRTHPSLKAMVVAIGGMNTKPSFGIYGTSEPARPWGERDDRAIQREIYSEMLPEPAAQAEGELEVEAYAINYGRDCRPDWGIVMGKLDDGRRTLAFIDGDAESLEALKEEALIKSTAPVCFNADTGRNLVTFR